MPTPWQSMLSNVVLTSNTGGEGISSYQQWREALLVTAKIPALNTVTVPPYSCAFLKSKVCRNMVLACASITAISIFWFGCHCKQASVCTLTGCIQTPGGPASFQACSRLCPSLLRVAHLYSLETASCIVWHGMAAINFCLLPALVLSPSMQSLLLL